MEATPRQRRAVLFASRRHPDLVKEMLATRGGSIENLQKHHASEILTAVEQHQEREKNREQDGGQKDEQKQEQQMEQEQKEDEQENEQQRQNRRSGFRPGSKQEYIANALKANDLDPEKTREALKDKIGQIPALTFMQNEKGSRVPLPMGSIDDDSQALTQYGRALKTIFAVRRSLINGGQGGDGKREDKREREEKQENRQNREQREATELLAWVRQLRKFCQDRDADGHPIDEIGLRPVEYGAAMLKGGIPLVAIKHAITMHYPPEARRALSVRDYDVQSYHTEDRIEGVHAALPYIHDLTECLDFDGHRLPCAMVGPKGTGKTTLSRQLAQHKARVWERDCPYGFVSMTSGTSPSAFNGRPRIADPGTQGLIMALIANAEYEDDDKQAKKFIAAATKLAKEAYAKGDVVLSLWQKIYGGGGVWLFDEMDAADENLLLGVNAALANGYFANPATGEIVERHPDFIPMAGMNTLGLGSGRDYKARNALDAATLDRWNAGRVQIILDPRIEESLFWTIINR